MIIDKIWKRYFLKEFLKIFFLFLICFYGLYVIIDYASHTSALPHHQTQVKLKELARYYLFTFSSRAEILIPFALLIALIKTLCALNTRHELMALMASGMKLHNLLRPFLYVGLFFTMIIFINEQLLVPIALKKLRRIEDKNKSQKTRNNNPAMAVHHLILEDGALLLYQAYDTAKEQFFDVYWIPSLDHIYRIKYLAPYTPIPTGYFVNHLARLPSGELTQQESFKELPLKDIRFNKEVLQSTLVDADAMSLIELWKQAPDPNEVYSEKESKTLTAFYWKLTLPWLCLLAILAPVPFCVRYSRQLPVFLIYVCGIFGLLAFYLLMDAAQVVAKRQVISPFWAICGPFFGVFGFFGWRFAKLQ